MTVKRLSLTTTGAELDRSVLRSGRLLDTLNRSSLALGVLDSELYDAAHRSGLLTVLGRFRCLDVHFVLSDEERVLESRCRQITSDRMYSAVVAIDGRNVLDAPVEELYWRKYRAGLACLGFISRQLGALETTSAQLGEMHLSAPPDPPFPPIPADSPDKRERYDHAQFASSGLKSGQLVVTISKDGTPRSDADYEALFQTLKDALMPKNLGIWVGDSQSRASAEIEFSCKNTAKASAIVRELLEASSANFTLQVLAD
jgi:hypothetical protein